MAVEIRPVSAEELPEFGAVPAYAFANQRPQADREAQTSGLRPDWTLAAVVDGRIATSFVTFPFRVRWNGARARMGGVSMVATLPEFRRRGLLRDVMLHGFADQRDRGQSVAILWASMGAIYQRFGYGLASELVSYEVEPRRIEFAHGDPAAGMCRLTPGEEARPHQERVYAAMAEPRNLLLERAPAKWALVLEEPAGQRLHHALYEVDGEVRGYLSYRTQGTDTGGEPGPGQRLDVVDAAWLDADAWRGLWEHLARHDLVRRVHWSRVAPDDPAPLVLLEPRELRRRTGDGIWMRIVEVPGALAQRPYGDAAALTVEVVDPVCDWNHGTWAVETTGDATEVTKVDADADLRLRIHTLAPLLSGLRSATDLAGAGLLEARDPKVLATADRVFATVHPPWCTDGF